jgi:hypothetical protein
MSYVLIKKHDNQHTHIQFAGSFQEQPVTWDTQFFTLDGYNAQESIEKKSLNNFFIFKPVKTMFLN